MNVGEIVYRILGDDTQFNSVMGKVGATASKALSAISKAALAVTGAAAAAVGALAKSAIDGYAEYEQLVGGVETLFKDSADVIKGYADEAYKTAGMSANAYMETVTGFSASLLQGLGGDTAKAAEIANQAVIDMSDNANKMGTDMSLIQNAYQGFAKQNYTMLDNLKLGYGGTQSEMARLINDSGVLGDSMRVTAETVNSVSFDKIIEAIHVVQTEMGITGTTAKEASTTIQGSITSMKGAWENFMVGLADPTQDFDRLVSNLVDSVITVSENLMPRIMAVLPQMATGITELAGELLPLIPETLNAMLPGVLEGANNLVSALLDTISSIADTAIPIITENADEIIDTLLTGLVDAVPKLITKAADLCTALISAILDNADIITQGAVDIVIALADGISQNLDTLIPAAVKAVLTIVDTLIYNIDELLDAAEELIKALADGLIDALPELLAKAPEIVIDLIAALVEAIPDVIEFAVELCEQIGSNIVNYDWETVGSDMYQNLHNALENALHGDKDYVDEQAEEEAKRISRYSSLTGEQIDKMIADNSKKLGEFSNMKLTFDNNKEYDRSLLPDWMKLEMDMQGETSIGAYLEKSISDVQQTIEDLSAARVDAVSEIEQTNEEIAEALEETANVDEEGAGSANTDEESGVVSQAEMLDEALKDLEAKYAIHQLTEEQYWAKRKSILEQYRNEEDAEWWKLYDKVTDHYDKLADTEAKAAQKASKEQETALKTALEDKFRELETEQLKKDYDDSWLLEQKRAAIEALDHNTDLYKDNDLKLLKEQKSYNDKALKETEDAAKKQQDALEKSYESIVKSRDSLASSLSQDSDIFQVSEETDKRTGAKKKSSGFDTSEYERKLAAKKKLTSKIAELYEKDAPDSLIRSLLKKDPEDALTAANQLLRDSKKLSEIKSMFKEDETVNNTLANIVTENSEDFKALGEEAGTVFGEGFMSAFRENWEGAFQTVFGDEEYTANASVKVNAANNSAAETTSVRRDYSVSDNSATNKAAKASGSSSQSTYKIIDLNGRYVAAVVNAENARSAKTGGG